MSEPVYIDKSQSRTVGPVSYPISIGEAKGHLRVTGSDEDSLIQQLIATAVDYVESVLNFRLASQTWTMSFDAFPAGAFHLSQGKATAVNSITYNDNAGVEQTVPTSVYGLDEWRNVIYLKSGQSWPSSRGDYNDVTVTYVVGSNDPVARQALLVFIGEMYETREDSVTGSIFTPTNLSMKLINMIRRPTPWRNW